MSMFVSLPLGSALASNVGPLHVSEISKLLSAMYILRPHQAWKPGGNARLARYPLAIISCASALSGSTAVSSGTPTKTTCSCRCPLLPMLFGCRGWLFLTRGNVAKNKI